MVRDFLQEIPRINFIDIGSSGGIDPRWKPIQHLLHLVGFDPNAEECARMAQLPHQFHSVEYLPYAIAGERACRTLYKTKSIYCTSLLRPNTEWLKRFTYSDLFEIVGEESIAVVTLDDLEQIRSLDVDVVKSDTQGLELPILRAAPRVMEKAFLVETETGFVENYIGETTYADIDLFMREKHFLLFDLDTSHRIARKNALSSTTTGHEQILWCEALWLKDYVALAYEGKLSAGGITREKALKVLLLCSLERCFDYGLELARLFFEFGLVERCELQSLEQPESWILWVPDEDRRMAQLGPLVNAFLRLLPYRLRNEVRRQAEVAVTQNPLWRR